jgi:hypothetical protein
MAKQGGRKLLIPVRTRNRFTASGNLKKNNYNLYTKQGHYESAAKIAAFFAADIVWVTVTVDVKAKTFSACMGKVSKLPSPKSIPMHPNRHVPTYDRLAIDVPHAAICESWSNIVEVEGN